MTRASWTALAVGLVGLVVWAAMLGADVQRALLAWLFAFTFALTVALGALILVLATDVTGATWFLLFRPAASALAATLPLFAVLFVPVLVGARELYPWGAPSGVLDPHDLEALERARRWLTHGPFVARAAAYLAAWSFLGWRVHRPAPRASRRRTGAVGLLVVGVTGSWAAFEWLMSLALGWPSTIFGLLFCVDAFLAGTCAVVLAAWLERRSPSSAAPGPEHFHAIGRLTFVGLSLWAYVQFSQLLIIWLAHLPREVVFYVDRDVGVWRGVGWLLVFGHFALPFIALLMRWLKRNPTLLALTCAWLLLMHVAGAAWLVLPFGEATPAGVDLAALAAVSGLTSAAALRLRAGNPPLREDDPALAAALRYESP